jgi:hypothetical protein
MMRLVALFLLIVALAQTITSQNILPGSISGRVTDADTGAPLAGQEVGSREVGYATTGADGRYVIRGVPPQVIRIDVRGAGGNAMATSNSISRQVTVVSNRDTGNVDLPVRLQGSISGRVLDADGNPLQGLRVVAIMRQYSRDGGINGGREYSNGTLWHDLTSTSSLFNRITDDRGFYNIDGLYSGRSYWIMAYAARPPRNSTGTVSDAPADPKARAPSIMPAYHPAARSLDAAVPVVLKAAERRESVDIRIARAPSYCLAATITAAGIPPPLQVAVVEEELFRLDDYLSRQTTLGPDGKIRVCDLYPGEFRLLVMQGAVLAAMRSITVTDADVRGVTLNAAAPPALEGEIAWDVDNAQTVQDVRVRVGITPFSGARMISTATRIPDSFILTPAPLTPYSLQITGLQAGQYVKDITYNDSSVLRGAIVPGSGGGRLRITVGRDGSRMTVQVNNDAGEPIPDSLVSILPLSAQSEQDVATSVIVGLTDEHGTFSAEGLRPGMYSVIAPRNLLPFKRLLPGGTVLLDKTPEVLRKLLNARSRGTLVEAAPGGVQTVVVRRTLVE